jgi:hypothetical protein
MQLEAYDGSIRRTLTIIGYSEASTLGVSVL